WFTPDGRKLVMLLNSESALRFWDLETGEELLPSAEGHRDTLNGVGCLPDGTVVTTSLDNTIRIWDPTIGRMRRQGVSEQSLYGCGFACVGTRLILPTFPSTSTRVHVWDVESNKAVRKVDMGGRLVYSGALSPDGKILGLSSEDLLDPLSDAIDLWDIAS